MPGSSPLAADSFPYRSLSRWAVASVVLGLLSLLTAIDWIFLLVPIVGIWTARVALRQIERLEDVYTGRGLARTGLILCIVFGLSGGGWWITAKAREVPHGYTPVTYAELKADDRSGELYPARAMELNDKKIFVKGYMYPGRAQVGLSQFLISRDNGTCAYCTPNPTPTDLIHVILVGDLRTNYTTHPIALGGRLRVETDPARIARDGMVYHLEADYLK
jgi:hypothetical protein